MGGLFNKDCQVYKGVFTSAVNNHFEMNYSVFLSEFLLCVFLQGPQGPPGGLGNPGPIGEKVQR